MSKFKVGDKVRFKSDDEAFIGLGQVGYDAYKALGVTTLTIKTLYADDDFEYTLASFEEFDGEAYARRLVKRRVRKVITKQGLFSFVYRKLVKQGRSAATPDGTCLYRLEQAGKTFCCAAGWLLSDGEAKGFNFDGTWSQLSAQGRTPERFKGFDNFILELQYIHDYKFNTMFQFKNEMASFAAFHGLTVPQDV